MVKGIPPEDSLDSDLKKLFDFLYDQKVLSAVTQKDVGKLDDYYARRQMYCDNLERALYLYDHDKLSGRPTHKLGFLGLWGEQVDSVDHFSRKLEKYNTRVEDEQTKAHPYSGNGFITFTQLSAAAACVQTLHGQDPERYVAVSAPEPCDVYWPNLSVTARSKLIRAVIVGSVTSFSFFFFMLYALAWCLNVCFCAVQLRFSLCSST